MKKFAFWINFGTEIRTFCNSSVGFLLDEGIILTRVESSFLEEYARAYNAKIILIPDNELPKKNRLHSYLYASKLARRKIKKIPIYRHGQLISDSAKIKDFIIGNRVVFLLIFGLYRKFYNDVYSDYIARLLNENNITDLILGEHNSSSLTISYTAKTYRIRTWAFVHSWKDIYVDEFIPIKYNGLFVDSEKVKDFLVRSNPYFPCSNVYVTGHPRLNAFIDHQPKHPLSYYEAKYNIKLPFILYTCVHPNVYATEERIIQAINREIKSNPSTHNISIVVKPNPMDNSQQRFDFLKDEGIRIFPSQWEWFPEQFFNIPSMLSEMEYLDVLFYSSGVLNIASTVSLEALLMRKQAIAITFSETGLEFPKFKELANAPFYKDLHTKPNHFICNNISLLPDLLLKGWNNNEYIGDELAKKWNSDLFNTAIRNEN